MKLNILTNQNGHLCFLTYCFRKIVIYWFCFIRKFKIGGRLNLRPLVDSHSSRVYAQTKVKSKMHSPFLKYLTLWIFQIFWPHGILNVVCITLILQHNSYDLYVQSGYQIQSKMCYFLPYCYLHTKPIHRMNHVSKSTVQ